MVGFLKSQTMLEKLDLINSKIDLLKEQMLSIQQCGFFTEMEIDRLSRPLKIELDKFLITRNATLQKMKLTPKNTI
jgi:hypothetical protein